MTLAPSIDSIAVGTLNPDWVELEKKLGFRPTINLRAGDLNEIREAMRKGAMATEAAYPPPEIPGLETEDKQISTVGNGKITVRVYTSDKIRGKKSPVCIFYHGGGFVLGDIDREDALCKAICSAGECVVVNVGYRHAPEFPYPIPVEDSYNAVLWTFDNIDVIGGDPDLVFTAGNSAGGNLATVVTRKLRDSNRKERIAAQILRVPVVCHPDVYPESLRDPKSSYYAFHDAPILSTKVMEDFWYFYNPGKRAGELDCSPLLATEFEDFPPTYISVAGCDPLRDQAVEYAKKLHDAGVNVKFDMMSGYPHGHNMWPQLGKGWQDAMDMMLAGVKWGITEAKKAKGKA